jgi:hypothetical protein
MLVVGPTGCPGGLPVGDDRGETLGTLLNKACRFPILVQHFQPIHCDPAGDPAGGGVHRMRRADRGAPGQPEDPIGAMGKAGTCSTCSYNRSLYSRMVARTFNT